MQMQVHTVPPVNLCVSFAYSCDEYKQNDAETSCNITLHYRLLAPGESNQAKLLIKKINSKDDLEKYDNLYNFFLRENHGSRLVNYWTKNEHEFINGEKSIYLAYVDQNLPIGFAIVDFYKILNACDVSQIFIEDLFQKKGYGTQFLQLMVDELSDSCFEIYYSSVNIDNIASRKTAEKVGFGIVGYRMNINS